MVIVEKIIIRKARIDELGQIQNLTHRLFAYETKSDRLLNTRWPYQQGKKVLEIRIRGGKFVCFVAEFDKKIVGYLTGEVKKGEPWKPVRKSELESMFVQDEYRSKGIGRKLTREFLKWSKKKGVKRAVVFAYVANKRAVKFYKRLGFNEDTIFFEKEVK